jgi:hypothetical protein
LKLGQAFGFEFGFVEEEEEERVAGSRVGDTERGVDRLLGVPEPRVATTDGEEGGSGDRVK